jgi:hypothetical protein
MKDSRKEFIKNLHSEVSSGFKTVIEKEFPELFKKDGLVVGKWYKYSIIENWKLLITDNAKGKVKGVGISCSGEWMTEWTPIGKDCLKDLILCSDKEVGQALIKEAKKKGFKEGVNFKRFNSHENTIRINLRFSELEYHNKGFGFLTDGYGSSIFDNGKWAEIVKETITKEQAEKELGKTILN